MDNLLELRRQIFHILLGIISVILVKKEILKLEHMFIILLIGVILSIICRYYKIPIISWFLRSFDRKNEVLPGKGAITYVLGMVIVLGLFSENTALASIMILALGDSFSHLGVFGRIRNPLNEIKTLEGTIIGVLFGAIGASFFVPWKIGLIGSLISMSIESLDIKVFGEKIDDNLLIPIISGFSMGIF